MTSKESNVKLALSATYGDRIKFRVRPDDLENMKFVIRPAMRTNMRISVQRCFARCRKGVVRHRLLTEEKGKDIERKR